jgi:hypothetical protein
MISILVIKDICEIISDNLVIFNYLLLLQIGPKNLGNIIIKFIIYNFIDLLYII